MALRSWHVLIAVLLVLLASLRIAATYRVLSHTIDEPDNLAAGLEYLSTGKYLYSDVHPPFPRLFAAAGPYLAGERFRPGPNSYMEGYRVLGRDAHYDRILALGRFGILPFFWLGCAAVFLWGYRTGGPNAAVISTLLFTLLPPILGHAGMITTDMAVAAMVPAAALAALRWAERPSRGRTVGFGVLLGLAAVSKFSSIPFLIAGLGAMWLAGRVFGMPWKGGKPVLLLAVAFLVVWTVYGFTFARVDFLHLRLPAPRFFTGLHAVWQHNAAGHPSYLLGQRSPNGFWYYFPTVLALKTPIAFLLLALGGGALLVRRRERSPAVLPLVFSLGILLIAMTGRVDIGVRYLLPIYGSLAVWCGWTAVQAKNRTAKALVAVLIAWCAWSGARQHPDYLAYTNEFTGNSPERFLADSDVDWGQDMNRLSDLLREAGATHVTFNPFNRTYALAGHAMPPMSEGESSRPSPGWNAVSVSIWKIFGVPEWAGRIPPQRRIGRGILVWYFPNLAGTPP